MEALVALVPVLFLGLVFLRAGLHSYRTGETPHCSQCDYNLTGLTSDHCPECGAVPGPDTIVQGEKHRTWVLAVIGFVLLACSLPFVGRDLYNSLRRSSFCSQMYPVWVLERLALSTDWQTREEAFDQLTQRLESGKLDARQASQAVDLALKRLPKLSISCPGSSYAESGRWSSAGGSPQALTLVSGAVIKGNTSESQKTKFLRGRIPGEVLVRARVRQGDPVPYSVRATGQTFSMLAFYGFLDRITVRLDGQVVGSYPVRGILQGSTFAESCKHSGLLLCDRPGKHTLGVSVHVVFYERRPNRERRGKPFHAMDVPFEAVFVVVPRRGDPVGTTSAPALTGRIRSVVLAPRVEEASDGVNVHLSIKEPPASLAFDIIARVNGNEYPAGNAVVAQSDPWWHDVDNLERPPSLYFKSHAACPRPTNGKIDVILRSNPDRARETVDIYQIWGGELEFKDVPVERAE